MQFVKNKTATSGFFVMPLKVWGPVISKSTFVATPTDRLIVRANIIRSGDAIMTKPFLKTIRAKIKKKMRKMFINATRHPPALPPPGPRPSAPRAARGVGQGRR